MIKIKKDSSVGKRRQQGEILNRNTRYGKSREMQNNEKKEKRFNLHEMD